MRSVSFILSFVLICVVLSPVVSAENNVVINFIDTKSGEAPENINLQIIDESGNYWNITTFPQELELEDGNYSVIASLNLIGSEVTTIDLQDFEVGSGNENYSITNDDYESYGLVVVAEYSQHNGSEIYTVYLTFEGGPIEYIVYIIYGIAGLTILGLLRSLLNSLRKIKNKNKKNIQKMEDYGIELEPDVDFDPKIKNLKFDQVLTYEGSVNSIDLSGDMKVSDAWDVMKKQKVEDYDIRITDDENRVAIIANNEFKNTLKKVNAVSSAKTVGDLADVGGKLEQLKFWIKLGIIVGIAIFVFLGFDEDLLDIRNRINEFL